MGQQIVWSHVDGDGGVGMMKSPLSVGISPIFELVKISINIDKFTGFFDKFLKNNLLVTY